VTAWRPTSWRAVAIELGVRMEHHARCYQHTDELDPECPFCLDRQAYLWFREKLGSER
jgi:hypothetical protein